MDNTIMEKKIFAAASLGGHWKQLLRITKPLEERFEVVYVSTHPQCATMIGESRFYLTSDFSRNDAWRMFPAFFRYRYPSANSLFRNHTSGFVS